MGIYYKDKYEVLANDDVINYIDDIRKLDEQFYKKDYLWDNNYQRKIYDKNHDSFICITYNKKLIGYINYLVIKEDKYNIIKKSNITIDKYNIDDIVKLQKNHPNYITLNSVVIDKFYQDGYAIKLLTNKFNQKLKENNKKGYKIVGISAIAVSKDGQHFLDKLGFIKEKKLIDNNYLYLMENNYLKNFLK